MYTIHNIHEYVHMYIHVLYTCLATHSTNSYVLTGIHLLPHLVDVLSVLAQLLHGLCPLDSLGRGGREGTVQLLNAGLRHQGAVMLAKEPHITFVRGLTDQLQGRMETSTC